VKHAPLSTAGISLRHLLAEEAPRNCPSALRVASCTCDWRQVQPGDVFVAVTGESGDGHDHAVEAVARGAVAVICERTLPVFNVPVCVVSDSRTIYGRLCQALVGEPSRQMKVIGVTGTSGKTTVVRLLSAVLREAGHTVGTLDSFGYWDGVEDRPASNGPLTPTSLARSLAEMVAIGATHAVVELSSQDLARQTFAGVVLDAACITNIGKHHLDWHGSLDNYRQAKRRILEHLEESGVAVLNADNAPSVDILDTITRPVLTFGMKGAGEIAAQVVEQHINEQTFLLTAGDDSVGVRTEIVGDHHVYNCLAAATTALAYGVEMTTIARGLESVDRLPGRMERVMGGQPFAVLVDSADSPDALRSCLRAARRAAAGRLICVFGASSDCESTELPAIGRVIGAMSDLAAITKGSPGEFGSHRSCLEVRTGFAELSKVQVILDRQEAIQWAIKEAREGDVVVIAGMGTEPHTPLGSEGALANDTEIVRETLRSVPAAVTHRMAA
jgi:UDP-N-acetylmuramoyl-L-alanyl-D-glutamate--2,6-diaminopimelate ligase